MVKVNFTLDRQTDGQTNGQTDRQGDSYIPRQTSFAGGGGGGGGYNNFDRLIHLVLL